MTELDKYDSRAVHWRQAIWLTQTNHGIRQKS